MISADSLCYVCSRKHPTERLILCLFSEQDTSYFFINLYLGDGVFLIL